MYNILAPDFAKNLEDMDDDIIVAVEKTEMKVYQSIVETFENSFDEDA